MLVGPEPRLRIVGAVLSEHRGGGHAPLFHRVRDRLEPHAAPEERNSGGWCSRRPRTRPAPTSGSPNRPRCVVALDSRRPGEVGDRFDPDSRHHDVGGDLASVAERHGAKPRRCRESPRPPRRSEGSTPRLPVELRVERRELGELRPAEEQPRQRFDDGHREPGLDRDGGDLEPDVAASHHHHAFGAFHRRADPVGVLDGAKVEHLRRARPRAFRRAGAPGSRLRGGGGRSRGCGRSRAPPGARRDRWRRPRSRSGARSSRRHRTTRGAAGRDRDPDGRRDSPWTAGDAGTEGWLSAVTSKTSPSNPSRRRLSTALAARLSAPDHHDARYPSHAPFVPRLSLSPPGTAPAARHEPLKVTVCGERG